VSGLAEIFRDLRAVSELPKVRISLMASHTVSNDPFYGQVVHSFYRDARRRHPRFPLIRNLQYGVALFPLPKNSEEYLSLIEASARRNIKKALRLGYTVSRIDFNRHRPEIAAIIRSAPSRQGPMPADLLTGDLAEISDPPSRTSLHDYIHMGVKKDEELRAYCSCFIAGELVSVNDIFGHDAHQSDGIVPLLLAETVRYVITHHPQAKYFMYDKYFGASTTLRRFKKKFGFLPHKVEWSLD
jgi:hypothetical protein